MEKVVNAVFIKISILFVLFLLIQGCGGESTRKGGGERQPVNLPSVSCKECPCSKTKAITSAKEFDIVVYLENSKSMDGYISMPTNDFKNNIYDLLVNIKNKNWGDLSLSYLNSVVTFNIDSVSTNQQIKDFILSVTPNTFSSRGNDRNTSDIANILEYVLTNDVSKGNLAIIVSDFILSPSESVSSEMYFSTQKTNIKSAFYNAFNQQPDIALTALQFKSEFSGTYSDMNNSPIHLTKAMRPYYIWFLGTTQQIAAISQLLSNRNASWPSQIIYFAPKPEQLSYRIDKDAARLGTFSFVKGCNCKIQKAEKGKSGFGFAVKANFSSFLPQSNYFDDSSNYSINSTSGYSITSVNSIGSNLNNYTHEIHLQATGNQIGSESEIEVKRKLPNWVSSASNRNDTKTGTDTLQLSQTFGLEVLLSGVLDAYNDKDSIFCSLPICIKE